MTWLRPRPDAPPPLISPDTVNELVVGLRFTLCEFKSCKSHEGQYSSGWVFRSANSPASTLWEHGRTHSTTQHVLFLAQSLNQTKCKTLITESHHQKSMILTTWPDVSFSIKENWIPENKLAHSSVHSCSFVVAPKNSSRFFILS